MQSGYQQKSYQQSGTVLSSTGMTDNTGARSVARRIMDTYDRDRNDNIDSTEVVSMIIDAYKAFNRVFSPNRADIESYLKVLDINNDGKVSFNDIQALCNRYLRRL